MGFRPTQRSNSVSFIPRIYNICYTKSSGAIVHSGSGSRMVRRAFSFIVVIAASCARSGLELGDVHGSDGDFIRGGSGSFGDDDSNGGAGTTGATGGAVTTGGIGGTGASPFGGSGSGGDVDPGARVPDCGVLSPELAPSKPWRWLAVEA